MFHFILVPLDGSAYSAAALPVARTVATATGSAIQLLRVVTKGSQTQNNQAASYLEPIGQELRTTSLRVDATVEQGDPATEILKFARTRDVDLIVMATHAQGSRSILALTSVARQVLAESPAPILMVHPGGRGAHHIQKLLVPVDGSPGGSLALALAASSAARCCGGMSHWATWLARAYCSNSASRPLGSQLIWHSRASRRPHQPTLRLFSGLLVFSAVSFAPLAFFVRGATSQTKRTR